MFWIAGAFLNHSRPLASRKAIASGSKVCCSKGLAAAISRVGYLNGIVVVDLDDFDGLRTELYRWC
jgi:hypothetical protein